MEKRDYLTPAQFAERVNRPLGSVYHDTRQDRIPGQIRLGRLVRIHWPSFEQAMSEKMVKA